MTSLSHLRWPQRIAYGHRVPQDSAWIKSRVQRKVAQRAILTLRALALVLGAKVGDGCLNSHWPCRPKPVHCIVPGTLPEGRIPGKSGFLDPERGVSFPEVPIKGPDMHTKSPDPIALSSGARSRRGCRVVVGKRLVDIDDPHTTDVADELVIGGFIAILEPSPATHIEDKHGFETTVSCPNISKEFL